MKSNQVKYEECKEKDATHIKIIGSELTEEYATKLKITIGETYKLHLNKNGQKRIY